MAHRIRMSSHTYHNICVCIYCFFLLSLQSITHMHVYLYHCVMCGLGTVEKYSRPFECAIHTLHSLSSLTIASLRFSTFYQKSLSNTKNVRQTLTHTQSSSIASIYDAQSHTFVHCRCAHNAIQVQFSWFFFYFLFNLPAVVVVLPSDGMRSTTCHHRDARFTTIIRHIRSI